MNEERKVQRIVAVLTEDANSSVATDELKSTIAIAEMKETENQVIVNSSVATDELAAIDIYHTWQRTTNSKMRLRSS